MTNKIDETKAGASKAPQWKDFSAILGEIIAGTRELPHAVEVDLAKGVTNVVTNVVCGGSLEVEKSILWAKLPSSKSPEPARYFLSRTQGGVNDGSGSAMVWTRDGVKIVDFAICEHKNIGSGTHDQEMRGWRPAVCRICGLDMSVDSGD